MAVDVTDPNRVAVTIRTPRTTVRLAEPDDVAAIVAYYTENRERLKPFDPERPPIFYEERFWRMQVRQNLEDTAADRALRLFIFPVEEPRRVIGNISFSNIVRGIAQFCTVGYSIGGDFEGRGLMKEAVAASLRYVFGSLNLHRVEANYMPHNVRSGQLLRSLGFVLEGYSQDYLRINGRWEDHVRAALLHPHWE